MADKLIGEWALISNENFDEVMKKLGVNFFTRKIGNTLKPNVNIAFNKDTNKWSVTTTSTLKTHKVEFELNKEFDEETLDGRHVKSIVAIDGNKLVNTQKNDKGEVVCVVTREVNDKGEHVTIVQAGDVIAKRVYNKV